MDSTTDDDSRIPRRRVLIRRSRGGFAGSGGSGSNRLDGVPREREEDPDEVDEAIDPEEINRRVAAIAPSAPAAPDDDGGQAPRAPTPQQRMFEVARAGSAAYAKEYRLDTLSRLLMRKIPLDIIARQLGVSVSTIEKDRAELKKRMREASRSLNIDEMIGGQTAFYEEVSSAALGLMHSGNTPTALKLAAGRTALAAQADKTRFYQSAGVFDVLKFRPSDDGTAISDVQRLMETTDRALQDLLASEIPEDDDGVEAPPRMARRTRAKPRKMGFTNFDEQQDSNPEVLDL